MSPGFASLKPGPSADGNLGPVASGIGVGWFETFSAGSGLLLPASVEALACFTSTPFAAAGFPWIAGAGCLASLPSAKGSFAAVSLGAVSFESATAGPFSGALSESLAATSESLSGGTVLMSLPVLELLPFGPVRAAAAASWVGVASPKGSTLGVLVDAGTS